jgi:hypothetical protein
MSAPAAHLSDPFFWVCLTECVNNRELIEQYDRLRGTNLSGNGSPIAVLVDQSTGKLEEEFRGFVEFVREDVYERCPRER